MATRRLEVEFIGDTKSLEKAFRRADGASDKAGKRFGAMGDRAKQAAKVGLVALASGAALAGPKIIGLASDAEETAAKFKTVFGRETERAIGILDRFSEATGTSRFELREQAAQFQALIRPMGLSTKAASGMSLGMTKLATDLASFNNTSVEEAILALQSGLVGEAEPLRRFGVQLSAARVETFAYAKGIAKQGEELTAAQKAQAAYGIILKDTKLAQGDAIRTSGSFANQFKRLKSQVKDTATEIGIALLPVVTKAVNAITSFIKGMKQGEGAGGRFVAVVTGMAGAVADIVGWFKRGNTAAVALAGAVSGAVLAFAGFKIVGAITAALAALRAAMIGVNLAMLANPAVLITAALIALGAGLAVAYKESETFRDIVDAAFKAVTATAKALWSVTKAVFDAIAAVITATWKVVTTVTKTQWAVIGGVLGGVFNVIKTAVTTSFNIYKDIITGVWSAVRQFTRTIWRGGDGMLQILTSVFNAIKSVAQRAWDGIKAVIVEPIGEAASLVRSAIRGLRDWLGERWGDIRGAATSAWNAFKGNILEPVRDAVSAVRGLLGNVKGGLLNWLRTRVSDFKEAASKLAKPFLDAFNKMKKTVGDLLDVLKDIVGVIKDVAGAIGKIKVPKIDIPLIGGIGSGRPRGDFKGGLPSHVSGFEDDARAFGLGVTSGFRPGDPGWHGVNRARDFSNGSGPTPQMMAFALYMARNFGSRLKELIYSPLGFSIDNGRRTAPFAVADHFDHVHVAFKDGGVSRGGPALVGEEGPEIAMLPRGTRVHPHDESMRMLGGGPLVHIDNVNVRHESDIQSIAEKLAFRVATA